MDLFLHVSLNSYISHSQAYQYRRHAHPSKAMPTQKHILVGDNVTITFWEMGSQLQITLYTLIAQKCAQCYMARGENTKRIYILHSCEREQIRICTNGSAAGKNQVMRVVPALKIISLLIITTQLKIHFMLLPLKQYPQF